MEILRRTVFIFAFFAALNSTGSAADSLDVNAAAHDDGSLVISFSAQKSSQEPISARSDQIYLWDLDEESYPYYMIGQGPGRRENFWVGVGHAERTDRDYLMISIRNLEGQFGQFFPQHLIQNFTFNGHGNPGRLEDGGLGIYPERFIEETGLPGVEVIEATSSMYELGTNHFYLRFNFQNDFYALKSLQVENIKVLGDGQVQVRLPRSAQL